MKNKFLLSVAFLLFGSILFAQAPQGLNYQAVARDAPGNPIGNQTIGVQFSINSGSPNGTNVYRETQNLTTNEFGLFTAVIGSGTPVNGTLAGVNWGSGPMFVNVGVDLSGGTSYTSMGAEQLQSVPYALYGGNAWNLTGNTGTNPSVNFIGTLDNKPLKFAINNQESGYIDSSLYRTFLGYQSGFNSYGQCNTGFGFQSLYTNGPGAYNTAIGNLSLYSNTGGFSNTASGQAALYGNTLGWQNTASGDSVLLENITGAQNVASGFEAMLANTSGSYNTGIGTYALFDNTTGNDNTALGDGAYPDGVSAGSIINWSGIGYGVGSGASASNMIELGNASVSVIRGQVGFTTYSDQRIKDNVTENVPGLDFITKLRPVTYNLNIHKQNAIMNAGGNKPDRDFAGKYDIEKQRMTGFIAQEVDQAAKSTGFDFSGVVKPANNNDLYSLRYSDFVVPLVKAVQEQQQQIADLKKLVSDLQNTVKQLQK